MPLKLRSALWGAAVVVVFLHVSGCAGGAPGSAPAEPGRMQERRTQEGGKVVTAVGRVEPAGMTVWMYGTHLLKDESGKVLYALTAAQSAEQVRLECWEGRRVRVAGALAEGYPVDSGPPYLRVTHVEAAESSPRPKGSG